MLTLLLLHYELIVSGPAIQEIINSDVQYTGYRDQIITRLHSVMGVCLYIHCTDICTLLCTPVSELVYCAFPTIPIYPLKFHLLVHMRGENWLTRGVTTLRRRRQLPPRFFSPYE